MASVLKVDKLDPQSGTALEIGTSGDTVSLPSGATLDISASTLTPPATMPASSGANLTALAAGNISTGTLATARGGTGTTSYTPGFTVADEWILTSSFQGDADPISSNLSKIESATGNVMTESSGIFTFPLTGFYCVIWNLILRLDSGDEKGNWYTRFTINDADYDFQSAPVTMTSVGVNSYNSTTGVRVVDVTDVSNCKVMFGADSSNTNTYTRGGADPGETACRFFFFRLGDT